MSVQTSIIAAILPVSAYLFFLWQADRFERESFPDILKHFFWGALGAVFLSLLGGKFYSGLLEIFIPRGNRLHFIESVYLAPLFEELSKAAFILFSIRWRKIDNVTDGLIYGGSIGLGFGMIENLFYFLLFSGEITLFEWIKLILFRSFFSAIMHGISTGAFGACAAKARFTRQYPSFLYYFAGISIAVFIHFIWNLSVSFDISFIFGLIFLLLMVALFIIYFLKQRTAERKIIIAELQEECDKGIIPYHHIPILTSKLKDKKGWIKEEIRKEYSNTAIKLAFRKYQVKNTNKDFDFYKKGVNFYKTKLLEITGANEI